jgi:type IV pilus assembly protein PilC
MNDIQFEYRAIDKNGEVKTGIKSATDEFVLRKDLKNENLSLIHAEPVNKKNPKFILAKILRIGRVSMHEKIIFTRNLATMIDAGLALSRGLTIIERQTRNPKLKRIVFDINEKVKKGSSLSDALKKYPEIFSNLVTSMVQSGEESGNLVESLNVVSDQMEKQYTLNKKIKGAMVYPGVIMTAMFAIGIFMLLYIVPTLTKTFTELSIELPASTRFIIGLSEFIKNNFFVSLIIVAVTATLFYLLGKSSGGKRLFDTLLLKIPMISEMVKEINSARTARTLASLLSAGVPFVRALQIVRDVVQNSYYKEVLVKAEKNIQLGLPISKVFSENTDLYPIFVGEMIAVGEETGELAPMLLKVASFYEEEVDQKTKNLSTIVEPFLMVVVGAIVGFFAISMISPMYSLVDKI